MSRPDRAARLLLALALALALATPGFGAEVSGGRPGMDVGSVLGVVEADGFRRALAPRSFEFPEDHGPHPDFRSEWWYLTAHLADGSGAAWGLQFTLFRQALAAPGTTVAEGRVEDLVEGAVEGASAWRSDQVWMAHLALTPPEGAHVADERFARGALDLAGVRAEPFAAWLDDWRLESSGDGFLPLRLTASTMGPDGVHTDIDLHLTSDRPLVLQGEAGLSRKSDRAGNASYYYSFTRLAARGVFDSGGIEHRVSGLGWLDREWSTSALDPGQTGWDWFALHLDDGRDLMIYRIRRDDGSVDAASAGVLVDAQGGTRRLARTDWTLEPLSTWRDETGAAWPVSWRLRVPSAGIDGRIRARVDDALNRLAVRYWEGEVCLESDVDGSASGCGYLELTGYESR